MGTNNSIKLTNEYILSTYKRREVVFVRGLGNYVWDSCGKKYLDFFPGWAVSGIGHCNKYVVDRVKKQISKIIHVPNNFFSTPQAELAQKIIKNSFKGRVFFCNSGAEANEGAIKLSRCYGARTNRHEIITMNGSFHGRTFAAMCATAQGKYHDGFGPLLGGFKYSQFNDIKSVQKNITNKTVAIMLEPIQGEGGINVATLDFLKGLRELCDKHKMLLIFDEVQTAMGRTGEMFCFKNYSVVPDIMTLAKSLGGGLPIGAMVVGEKLSEILKPGMHASTFGGSPLVCEAALGVFDAIKKDDMIGNVKKLEKYLRGSLDGLLKKYPKIIKEVRGVGFMIGVELYIPGDVVVNYCFESGLLINCTQGNVLRIMPALNIEKKDIDRAVDILDGVFAKI